MTKEELVEIRGRVDKASMGPWERNKMNGIIINKEMIVEAEYTSDIRFIAHARQDVPALLDEVERLHSKLEGTKEALNMYVDDIVPTLRRRLEELHRN